MSSLMRDGNRSDLLIAAISYDQGLLNLTRSVASELGLEVYMDEPRQGIFWRIARIHPSLVVLDVQLGHEAFAWAILRALKEYRATREIPVLACAAARWLLDAHASLVQDLCFETWSQPYDPAELLAKIDRAVCVDPSDLATVAYPSVQDFLASGAAVNG
jgi:CheY-like chemotaxis protein